MHYVKPHGEGSSAGLKYIQPRRRMSLQENADGKEEESPEDLEEAPAVSWADALLSGARRPRVWDTKLQASLQAVR